MKAMKTILALSFCMLLEFGLAACGGGGGGGSAPALINTTTLSVGDANCPGGGYQIDSGVDADEDGVLDPGEVDGTEYICEEVIPVNTAPVAEAGPDQAALTGIVVTLDGSGSSDAEMDPLTYEWSFMMSPLGSAAILNDTSAESPTFTPDRKGTYVLSLLVGDGRLWSEPDYVTITIGSWREEKLIDTDTNSFDRPRAAFDADGNAVAVWMHDNYNIYAKRYDAGTGSWSTAEIVETSTNIIVGLQLAVDEAGNAFAVWERYGTYHSIHASIYNGSGWEGAAEIDAGDSHAGAPQVAVDSSGNAIAVWRQDDGTSTFDIYARRYDAGSGLWGTAEVIDAGAGNADGPQVAVDTSGNAIAVWYQDDGTFTSINANRYDAGTDSWGTAGLIETGDNIAAYPSVAFDADGNAIAVWGQSDGTNIGMYANRYEAGTGWTGAVEIDAGSVSASPPRVAVDADGNAIAVWEQDYSDICANRYEAGTGWGATGIIDAGDGHAVAPQVAVDSSGNAIAVWQQYDGTYYRIHANRYIAGSGLWGTPVIVEEGFNSAYNPQVAVEAAGAIALWRQFDGTSAYDVYASRFE